MIRKIESLMLLLVCTLACGCNYFDQKTNSSLSERYKPVIIDNTNMVGGHVTTRPHNRKIIYHKESGYWYVFHGNGGMDEDGVFRTSWRSSKDGIHWSERRILFEGNAHSSSVDVLFSGNHITSLIYRVHYHRKQAGVPEKIDGKYWYETFKMDFSLPYEIQQYQIDDGNLIPKGVYSAIPGKWTNFAHYGSLTQDTSGYYWVGARAVIGGEKNPFEARAVRSKKVNDISEWDSHTVLHKPQARGTLTVQVIALDDGKVYAIIFSKPEKKIYGALYNPENETWSTSYVVAEGSGRSKRAVATFDPGIRRLHLVYINNSGALMHKILSYPYTEQDWNPGAGKTIAGKEIVPNVISKLRANNNISLSIDTSRKPAPMVVAYHKKTPHYYIRYYNGKEWQKHDYSIGMHDSSRKVDEISLLKRFNEKLGLIYYVLPKNKMSGEIHFIDIPKTSFENQTQEH